MRIKFILLWMGLVFNVVAEIKSPNNMSSVVQPQINKGSSHNLQLPASSAVPRPLTIPQERQNEVVVTNHSNVVMNNLDGVDNQTNDINIIKRKIELEKLKLDLKKSQNSITGSGISGNSIASTMPQTVATGIIINARGKKIATLNFADGSDLDVEVGNKVNDYYVTDITVNGVILTKFSKSGKRVKSILIKLSYPKMSVSNSAGNNMTETNTQSASPFTPTPTTTEANMDNTISSPFGSSVNNGEVPPIIAQ